MPSPSDWHDSVRNTFPAVRTAQGGESGDKNRSMDQSSSSSNTDQALVFSANQGRFRDQSMESSIAVQLWYSHDAQASTSSLSKAPLLREVPQVRRRLARKDREASGLVTDSRSFPSLKSAAPSWLREKPSRQKLVSSQSNPVTGIKGSWRKATAVCREAGVLLVYSEDHALLHSISLSDLVASDVRFVDQSLFFCPNVLGIFSRPSTLHVGARSPPFGARSAHQSIVKDEPIYFCFPTTLSMKRWRALLRSFAKPEIYGSPSKGGTHRCYRQIDMTILEARVNSDRPLTASRSDGFLSPSLFDESESDVRQQGGALGLLQATDTTSAKPDEEKEDESPVQEIGEPLDRAPILAPPSGLPAEEAPGEITEEVESIKVSDGDSDMEVTSGPISGLSGKDRIMESSPRSLKLSLFGESDKRAATETQANTITSSFCLVWMGGDIIAQTKPRSGTSNVMTWFDKFSLKDLPKLSAMQVDVMQSGRNGKYSLLGSVTLPLETMRRGESIEGWFPIWSSSPRESDGTAVSTDLGYTSEMVGEIKLALFVTEESVLPLRKYAAIEDALDSPQSISLAQALCKRLEEDRVIAHLVDIQTSRGKIVDFLSNLTEAESFSFGENPALLFRSNTLLTRAVDKYQRMFCRDWLDSCIGPTVRRICHDHINLEPNEEKHYYAIPRPDEDQANSSTIIFAESTLDALKRLCRELWTSIYASRHRCPRDLQSALCKIRTKVNACRFRPSENHNLSAGIQGVGAFVFLRLICPAITSPNLYGLMGSAPSAASSKTLMLVAKVFLALANKKSAFDKDKESWLVQANDFLIMQASAYDDFITTISTEAAEGKIEELRRPLGDENDYDFQLRIKEHVGALPALPRESIPSGEYILDRALSLASLVSYVVGEANGESTPYAKYSPSGFTVALSEKDRTEAEAIQAHYDEFIETCRDVEDRVGYYIDRAGYKPEAIDYSVWRASTTANKSHRSTQVFAALGRLPSAMSANGAKSSSMKSRRATVSEVKGHYSSSYRRATDFEGLPRVTSVGEVSTSLHRPTTKRFGTHLPSSSISNRFSQDTHNNDNEENDGGQARSSLAASGVHLETDPDAARGSSNLRYRASLDQAVGAKSSLVGVTFSDAINGEDQGSLRKAKQRWWKKNAIM